MSKVPRGIRNNNPLNLREGANGGIAWKGEHPQELDKSFEEFSTPEMGIRAGAKVLLTYYRKYGLNTVHGIINRFAPPVENNTNAYAVHVANYLNVGLDEVINVEERLKDLVTIIILHENGQNPYSEATIQHGVNLALA